MKIETIEQAIQTLKDNKYIVMGPFPGNAPNQQLYEVRFTNPWNNGSDWYSTEFQENMIEVAEKAVAKTLIW